MSLDKNNPRPMIPSRPAPRLPARSTSRPLADLIRPAVGEALKAQGFAAADILARWPEIVGARLAARCMPVRIVRTPRSRELPDTGPLPAILVLKVESAFAHEIEIASAQVLERVNAVFGWRVVGQLRLRQGPVERAKTRDIRAPAPLEPGRQRQLEDSVQGIEDEALRTSLERLGRAVLGKARSGSRALP